MSVKITIPASGTIGTIEAGKAPYLEGRLIAGIVTPAGLEGTSLTFQMQPSDGAAWVPIKDAFGNARTVTVSTESSYHALPPAEWFIGTPRMRLVAAQQAAERVFELVLV